MADVADPPAVGSPIRLGVCENSIRAGSLEEDAAAAAAAGFAGLGVELESILAHGPDRVAGILRDHGLVACNVLGLPELFEDPRAARPRYEAALDFAAATGAPGALVGTGALLDGTVEDGDSIARDRLGELGALAAERGVRIALEPMHPLMRGWTYVHTLRHAARLVEGLDGTGVAVDTGHLWWDPDLVADFQRHLDSVVTVQVVDVAREGLVDLRYERTRLGTGDVPVARLLRAFHEAGYRGWYECEVIARIPRSERPAFVAANHDWLVRTWDAVAEG